MAQTSALFEHTQRYVREVFAERLRDEGFVSYKGEDIHWYRLVNDEVVQAIYFITRHTQLPALMEIRYGCHPLYIAPIFQKSPNVYADYGDERMADIIPEFIPGSTPKGFERRTFIMGSANTLYREPDVLVTHPVDMDVLDILKDIFRVMDSAKTPAACYALHKKLRNHLIENNSWLSMAPEFVDEVVYWNDRALYPFCGEYITGMSKMLENALNVTKFRRKIHREELDKLMLLKQAVFDEQRDEHLERLQNRAQQNRKLLKEYTGI